MSYTWRRPLLSHADVPRPYVAGWGVRRCFLTAWTRNLTSRSFWRNRARQVHVYGRIIRDERHSSNRNTKIFGNFGWARPGNKVSFWQGTWAELYIALTTALLLPMPLCRTSPRSDVTRYLSHIILRLRKTWPEKSLTKSVTGTWVLTRLRCPVWISLVQWNKLISDVHGRWRCRDHFLVSAHTRVTRGLFWSMVCSVCASVFAAKLLWLT